MNLSSTRSLLCLSVVLLISCGDSGDQAESGRHAESSQGHAGHEVPAGEHGLALHGDEKWEMDEHTRAMFIKMAETFHDGEKESGSEKAMGEKMRRQIDELIQGCTMKGEAHDQLHRYLVVYIPAVEAMAKGGTQAQADDVGALLALYPEYFE